MNSNPDDKSEFSRVVFENLEKGFQYRLTANEFRDVEYLHLRKYFLTYEGDWLPSKEGASMPHSIQTVYNLLDGLIELCSRTENSDAITKYFKTKLDILNEQNP